MKSIPFTDAMDANYGLKTKEMRNEKSNPGAFPSPFCCRQPRYLQNGMKGPDHARSDVQTESITACTSTQT